MLMIWRLARCDYKIYISLFYRVDNFCQSVNKASNLRKRLFSYWQWLIINHLRNFRETFPRSGQSWFNRFQRRRFSSDYIQFAYFSLFTCHFSQTEEHIDTCFSLYSVRRFNSRQVVGRVNGELMEMRRAQGQAHKRKGNLRQTGQLKLRANRRHEKREWKN